MAGGCRDRNHNRSQFQFYSQSFVVNGLTINGNNKRSSYWDMYSRVGQKINIFENYRWTSLMWFSGSFWVHWHYFHQNRRWFRGCANDFKISCFCHYWPYTLNTVAMVGHCLPNHTDCKSDSRVHCIVYFRKERFSLSLSVLHMHQLLRNIHKKCIYVRISYAEMCMFQLMHYPGIDCY